MICKRAFGRVAGAALVGVGLALAPATPTVAQEGAHAGSQVGDDSFILQGADGLTRSTSPVEQPGVQGRHIELQPGDRIEISADGQTADLVNKDGDVVGSFTAPQIYDADGNELSARFAQYEDMLILAETGPSTRDACTKATVGKWTYRIGAAGVCGALGAATGGVAGGACGLGATWAEDNINFDSVC
ncbi:hypothetical protein [Corynebacterium timonense]|nr:hypothetical protein [Corynebacterium timonense]